MSAERLEIREGTAATWTDFVRLFESRSTPKYCWCMAWRGKAGEPQYAEGADRKSQIEKRVRAGTPVGILGYKGSEPVARCSIAPKSTFRGLTKSQPADDRVWSVTCFFVLRAHRGTGIAEAMLAAAVKHAK